MTEKIRFFISLVMKDKAKGVIVPLLSTILKGFSYLYLLGVKIVEYQYKTGMKKVYKSELPVISVGNITVGGTGKTPFCIFLADYLDRIAKKPAILTRGYGDDEHRMLEQELSGVPIMVGRNRMKNAKLAEDMNIDVLILDDGFQHRSIARDIDIVLIDSVSMFGNGFMLPRGVLREPVDSIKRAGIVVFTKTSEGSSDINKMEQIVRSYNSNIVVIFADHKPTFLTDVTGASYDLDVIKGERIAAVSGIGDPESFRRAIKRTGAETVMSIDFGDHHRYSQKDIDLIREKLKGKDISKIVVTKKDFVKIKDLDISFLEDRLLVLNIVIEIIKGAEDLIAGLNSIIFG